MEPTIQIDYDSAALTIVDDTTKSAVLVSQNDLERFMATLQIHYNALQAHLEAAKAGTVYEIWYNGAFYKWIVSQSAAEMIVTQSQRAHWNEQFTVQSAPYDRKRHRFYLMVDGGITSDDLQYIESEEG